MMAAKIRARRARGRPRKVAAERTASGAVRRRSEREIEADAMSVALEARVRRGVASSLADARDPACADTIGRLYRLGVISREERAAGDQFAAQRRRYLAAIAAPRASFAGQERAAGVSVENAARNARAVDLWLNADRALRLAGSDAEAAVRRAIEPEEVKLAGRAVPFLKCGLAALARHYGYEP